MECHDVQQLLAFVNRKCEELDAPEREAMAEHLEKCPDCRTMAQAELRADESLGPLLRDVPVPADLKPKLLQRLAAERGAACWTSVKRGSLAAAAVILIAITAGVSWHFRPLPSVGFDEPEFTALESKWDPAMVERQLADNGLAVTVPRELFDYRFFQSADVVMFKGRRVAKLNFARLEEGRTVTASVLVLSPQQFDMNELKPDSEKRHTASMRIHHENGFVNVIFYWGGQLAWLQGEPGV